LIPSELDSKTLNSITFEKIKFAGEPHDATDLST
jgi:hypothetical protein